MEYSPWPGYAIPIPELGAQLARSSLPGEWPYLALAESALRAMFDPRGASEAHHVHLVQAGFGDVIANGVGLARVGDTARAALTLREHAEFTFHLWARQGPAIHFPLLQRKQRCQGRGAGAVGRGGGRREAAWCLLNTQLT